MSGVTVGNCVEVEVRTFINEKTYTELRNSFSIKGKLIENTRQITHYLDHFVDTRVQISREGGKICQKSGAIHDESRRELEIKTTRKEAREALELFKNIGLKPRISWFRHRLAYQFQDFYVTLDNTVGYGMILEVELQCREENAEEGQKRLKEFVLELRIPQSSRQDFENAFREYGNSWKEKTGGLSESWLDEE